MRKFEFRMDKSDLSRLSDYQLYEIIVNPDLDIEIQKLANAEFESRNLDQETIKQIILKHDQLFVPARENSLTFLQKLLLILFPFVLSIPIQGIIAGRLLSKGQKRKSKELWLYVTFGYLFWTILIIFIARFFLLPVSQNKAYP